MSTEKINEAPAPPDPNWTPQERPQIPGAPLGIPGQPQVTWPGDPPLPGAPPAPVPPPPEPQP